MSDLSAIADILRESGIDAGSRTKILSALRAAAIDAGVEIGTAPPKPDPAKNASSRDSCRRSHRRDR